MFPNSDLGCRSISFGSNSNLCLVLGLLPVADDPGASHSLATARPVISVAKNVRSPVFGDAREAYDENHMPAGLLCPRPRKSVESRITRSRQNVKYRRLKPNQVVPKLAACRDSREIRAPRAGQSWQRLPSWRLLHCAARPSRSYRGVRSNHGLTTRSDPPPGAREQHGPLHMDTCSLRKL